MIRFDIIAFIYISPTCRGMNSLRELIEIEILHWIGDFGSQGIIPRHEILSLFGNFRIRPRNMKFRREDFKSFRILGLIASIFGYLCVLEER